MDEKQQMTRAELLAAPPKTLEEVDEWLVKYMAVINAARAEAHRVNRLRNAAPDLLKALTKLTNAAMFAGIEDAKERQDVADALKDAHAAISRAQGG